LDTYQDECFNLYAVLKALDNYPDIFNYDYIDEEGLLYAASFALLCERYIYYITKNHGNYVEDFDVLHHELKFETSISKLEDNLIEYRNLIISDLKKQFATEENVLRFFSSIFKMDEETEAFTGDYFQAQDFYHEYF
jgi:hypothetical protein